LLKQIAVIVDSNPDEPSAETVEAIESIVWDGEAPILLESFVSDMPDAVV
jgi:hypothetical protein